MNNLRKSSENKRLWDRFELFLKAKYSCEQFSRNKECTVLDMSVDGACLKLLKDVDVVEGALIVIELLNKDMNKVSIESLVVWIQNTGVSVLVGCKFKQALDTATFENLN
jgi:hypothetical protein